MNAIWGKRLLYGIGFALLIILILGIDTSGHGPPMRLWQLKSARNMKMIALGIELFQADNAGKLPKRLSELVPDYLGTTDIFYLKYKEGGGLQPSDADAHPKLIDIFSAYDFAPLSDGLAVVFERQMKWSDHTIGYCCTTKDAHLPISSQIGRVQPDEFQKSYLRDFKP